MNGMLAVFIILCTSGGTKGILVQRVVSALYIFEIIHKWNKNKDLEMLKSLSKALKLLFDYHYMVFFT